MRQSLVKAQPVTATLTYLPRGQRGTVQTLRLMAHYCRRDAASQQLRGIAHRIIGSIAGHDFNGEIRALFNFVREQIIYRKDPMEVERVQDALRTLQFGSGDCDDKVTLLVTLLAVCGHRARFCVSGAAPGVWTHVDCEVITPQGWLPLDPTPERAQPGWETNAPAKGVFEIWPAVSTNIRVVRAGKFSMQGREQRAIRRQVRKVPAAAFCLGCESGLGADTYEWKMNKGSGECELQKKSCGFFCKVGKGFKAVGKIAVGAVGAIAAPLTGGLSAGAAAAINGGIAVGQSVAAKYMSGVPAGSNVEEPKGECAAWMQRKQQEEQAKAEAAAAAERAAQQAEKAEKADKKERSGKGRKGKADDAGGLLSQPMVLGALILGGAMMFSRR